MWKRNFNQIPAAHPQLAIEPQILCYMGLHSTNRATPARAWLLIRRTSPGESGCQNKGICVAKAEWPGPKPSPLCQTVITTCICAVLVSLWFRREGGKVTAWKCLQTVCSEYQKYYNICVFTLIPTTQSQTKRRNPRSPPPSQVSRLIDQARERTVFKGNLNKCWSDIWMGNYFLSIKAMEELAKRNINILA